MGSLRNFLKLPKMIRRRIRSSVPIRTFDQRSDSLGNVARSGMVGGMLKTRIDEILETPGLTQQMIDSELHVRPDPTKRAYFNWDLPAFLWQSILGSKSLTSLVTDYLGPHARLDDLYVKSVMDGLSSVSEGWHDDNVGYRIKVFMVFNTEGQPSGTVVVPTNRPNLYQIRVADELSRFLFKPKTDQREGAVRVGYEPGDCLIFDTNIPHRGDYSTGEGVRYCVIAEFIDRDKANAIVGRAPCGPGQGRKQIRIPVLSGIDVETHPLIDPSLLHKASDGYRYGYAQSTAPANASEMMA